MTVIDESRGPWMQLVNGQPFYPFCPNFEVVTIKVIAHALAHLCRYGGHSARFYSVAEHCVLLAWYIRKQIEAGLFPELVTLQEQNAFIRATLMHDRGEGIVVDLPRPIKHSLPEFQSLENTIADGLADQFCVPRNDHPYIKEIDRRICGDEYRQILNPCVVPWGMDIEPLGITIYGWSPEMAKRMFLDEWESCKP